MREREGTEVEEVVPEVLKEGCWGKSLGRGSVYLDEAYGVWEGDTESSVVREVSLRGLRFRWFTWGG